MPRPDDAGERLARWFPFARRELPRLAWIYGVVAALNIAGWGTYLAYHNRFGALYASAGSAAFIFGVRHAFDADHISAVDETTRYLMQRDKHPLGVGLFFSLGHSTIVVALSLAIATAAQSVQRHIPGLQKVGGTVGATISGTFLILIGVLDLVILRGILDVWRKTKTGRYTPQELDDLLSQRGFLNRVLGSRWRKFVSESWQMYPIGVLFGLGFDTASEVALIGLTAAAATGGGHAGTGAHLPFMAILCLPLLFAGGMTLMDTTNGVVMTRAYAWAFRNPLRKVYYNMATVGLGVFVALGIGTIEYLQVFSDHAGLHGVFWGFVGHLNFQYLGYGIVATFVLVWIVSMLAYKIGHFEERYGGVVATESRDPVELVRERPDRSEGLMSRRLVRLVPSARSRVRSATSFGVAVSAAKIVQALLVARVLVDAFGGGGPSGPLLVALAAVVIVRLVLSHRRDVAAVAATSGFRRGLRTHLYRRLADLGPGYTVRQRTGQIQATLGDGVDALGSYAGRFRPLVIAAGVTVASVVAAAGILDLATGAALAVAALIVLAAPALTERAFGEAGRRFWSRFGQLSAGYLDAVQGMATLRASNADHRWGRRLLAESTELADEATGLNALASMHIGFVALGMAAGTAGVAAVAAVRVAQGGLGVGAALAVLLLARECFAPLAEVSAALPSAYRAVAAANGVFDLLDAVPPVAPSSTRSAPARLPSSPSIAFENVTFRYRPGERAALDGLSFSVGDGETVALVGRSGAGKSTVVSLLLRYVDAESGTVRIGGRAIADYAPADVRSLIAVTFQDTYLFHRSVRDNLLLGRPGASDREIEAAARVAHAHAFIRALPEGYDTVVGERGMRLSGGERQRLAIARVVLADRPILVLDEPTSSVDEESEALIRHALEELARGRTTLVIAHRLSTIEGADRVVVLDGGRAVEAGPPADLLSAQGAYARLVAAQAPS